MQVIVTFYGILADVTGTRIKTYSDIISFDYLKLRIFDDFPEIQHYSFRISRNDQEINSDIGLNDGDKIAFFYQ